MLRTLLALLVQLFREPVCVLCQHVLTRGYTCTTCNTTLLEQTTLRIETLAVQLRSNPKLVTWRICVLSGGIYETDTLIVRLIKRLKFTHTQELAEVLSLALYQIWYQFLVQQTNFTFDSANTLVTAPPAHWRRYNHRGFNQAEVLARGLAARLQVPFLQLWKRLYNTTSQVGKSGKERRFALMKAFSCVRSPPASIKTILIIDDVVTTGSTIRSLLLAWRLSSFYRADITFIVLTLKSRLVF